ncbi:MAG: hypothetical protein JWP13_53 [Candidatus Saccharibacteria bacterium]|nr:hypothetical protein [Candidatus Saccharibacteria bacterium]
MGLAAVAVLAACGQSDKEAEAQNTAPSSSVPESTATASPTAAAPTSEVTHGLGLQEQMTARAETGASELTQSLLDLAAILPEGAAPTEAAGDDDTMLRYARVDVPADGGTITHYEMYAQLQNPSGGADPANIESVTLEVAQQDTAGITLSNPYWLSMSRNPDAAGWSVTITGTDEAGALWQVADDFAGDPGYMEGYKPIATLEEEQSVLDQAQRVISDAQNGLSNTGERAPF